MIFDGSINVVGMDVIGPETDPDGMAAEGSHLQIALTLGLGIPVPGPNGMVIAPIPAAVARVPMTAEVAEKLIEELQAVVATIPKAEQPVASDSLLVADQAMADQVIAQSKIADELKKGQKGKK